MSRFKSKKPRTGFDRPTASAGTVDRFWSDVYPDQLTSGDIVPGLGVIVTVRGAIAGSTYQVVEAGSPESTLHYLPKNIQVKAFIRKA